VHLVSNGGARLLRDQSLPAGLRQMDIVYEQFVVRFLDWGAF